MDKGFAQLTAILEALRTLTGASSIWKISQNCLMELRLGIPYTTHHLDFCESVKDCHGIDVCVFNDTVKLPELVDRHRSAFAYLCHAGALEFVVPVYHIDGGLIGILQVGPFLPEEGNLNYAGADTLPRWRPELAAAIETIARRAIFPLAAELYSHQHGDFVKSNCDQRVLQVLNFIRNNFHLPITVEDAAKQVFLSSSRLSHLFQSECGTGFTGCLMEIRLRHARELLDQTDLSIHDIARRSGFSNQNHFAAIFSEKIGIPPSRYRRHRSMPMV